MPIRAEPFNAETAPRALEHAVTPTEAFFVRTNFDVPALEVGVHRVTVGGRVSHPASLTIGELRDLGLSTMHVTLECAGNSRTTMSPLPQGEPWGSNAVSTAVWTGVPLRRVLERVGMHADTIEVLVSGADAGALRDVPGEIRFARSLPVEKALHPDTLLALEMNGELLSPAHGAPLRLIVPGWYGMASVKWVTRIDALDGPFTGYFQKQRYILDRYPGGETAPVTAMRVKSAIVSPRGDEHLRTGRVHVRGWAWSGNAQIVRVEVAVGGGESWQDARLVGPVETYAWRAWEFELVAPDAGRYMLRARATDAAGNVQPEVAEWNRLGYCNNAVQQLAITVG
ncbi:MAG: sulfite oxidase [Gemmatimonadaceae bacterium]